MTTPSPDEAAAAEEKALLTGEHFPLPSSNKAESFTARDRVGLELRWEDGEFTSNWPPYLDAIKAMIDSGAWVTGLESTMPTAPAAATPGWVALFTATEALRLDELWWDSRNVEFPDDVFGYPPGAVA